MPARVNDVGALVVLLLSVGAFAACDRAETTSSSDPVTTSSPAGTSTAPSAAVADRRDDALFDGVDFQSVTNYAEIDPVNGEIEIRAQSLPAPIAKVPDAHIEAGRFYTLVIVGRVRATPKLEAFLIEDALKPGTTR